MKSAAVCSHALYQQHVSFWISHTSVDFSIHIKITHSILVRTHVLFKLPLSVFLISIMSTGTSDGFLSDCLHNWPGFTVWCLWLHSKKKIGTSHLHFTRLQRKTEAQPAPVAARPGHTVSTLEMYYFTQISLRINVTLHRLDSNTWAARFSLVLAHGVRELKVSRVCCSFSCEGQCPKESEALKDCLWSISPQCGRRLGFSPLVLH